MKNKITFQIMELQYVIDLLFKIKLVDYASRMRMRLIKILTARFSQYQEEYMELIKEHAFLDEHGEPLFDVIEGNKRLYKLKDTKAFEKANIDLVSEEFVIEIDDNNKKMLKSVTHSVLNCGIEFHGQDALNHDLICERFEELNLDGDKIEG